MTLTELRKQKGITQKLVAERLNVSERTIKAWEAASKTLNSDGKLSDNGNIKYPSIENTIEMANVFDISPIEIYDCFRFASNSFVFNRHKVDNEGYCKAITEYLSGLAGSEKERLLSGFIINGYDCFCFTNYYLNQMSDEDFNRMTSIESISSNSEILFNGFSPYKGILFLDNNNHSVYLDNKDTLKGIKYNRNSFGYTFSFLTSRNILTGEVTNEPVPFQVVFLYGSMVTNSDNPLFVMFDDSDDGPAKLGKILKSHIKNNLSAKEGAKSFNKDRISRLISGKISSYKDIAQISLITKIPVKKLFEIFIDKRQKFYAEFKEMKIGYNSYFENIADWKGTVDFIKYCKLANDVFNHSLIIHLYESADMRKLKLCSTEFHVVIDDSNLRLSSKSGESLVLNGSKIVAIEKLGSIYNSVYQIVIQYQIEEDTIPLLLEISIPNIAIKRNR